MAGLDTGRCYSMIWLKGLFILNTFLGSFACCDCEKVFKWKHETRWSKNWTIIKNYSAKFTFICMSHWPTHVYDFNLLCRLCTLFRAMSRLFTIELEIWCYSIWFILNVFSGGCLLTGQFITQWVEYMHQSWICQGISDSSLKIYSQQLRCAMMS